MKLRPVHIVLGGAGLLLIALGIWLWSRVGLAVWLDAAVAFCS
jgi:hypothetical protein